MRCKPQCANQERRQAVFEVRAAGEVTEELAAKCGIHRATLWRWAKAEEAEGDEHGQARRKIAFPLVRGPVCFINFIADCKTD
ncbi:Homeodomain-like [Phytophthora cactorum]|nr:Homeodomain-like [Phytophthora cactorum]